MTKFGRRNRRPIAAQGATAHYGGGVVFEVAFLKGGVLEHPGLPTVRSVGDTFAILAALTANSKHRISVWRRRRRGAEAWRGGVARRRGAEAWRGGRTAGVARRVAAARSGGEHL